MALLELPGVARRIAALAGIIVLLALALSLLWRVYVHHRQANPYERDEPVTVELNVPASTFVKIASDLS